MSIGKPQVIIRTRDGVKEEPFETLVVEVPIQDASGAAKEGEDACATALRVTLENRIDRALRGRKADLVLTDPITQKCSGVVHSFFRTD